ncbi:MAG: nuclear transport factor 2 family protein [Zoogloeaceae bacterium]|jgi:ketosteroid isomerase-like protein|nr:nuclear transport factor 2 family protein [Zoogloeaceae bacterium]
MNPPTPLLFATPEDAEAAFYEAIAKGNMNALMAVWADDEDVTCIHPTGQQISGLAAIRESWRQVLSAARLKISASRMTRWQNVLLAVHQMVENLQMGDEVAGPLLATHVFIQGPHGWRMVCRHCSASAESVQPMPGSARRVLH